MKNIIIFAIISVVAVNSVLAASFDCKKAGTVVEKAICNNAQVSEADGKLGELYSQLRKSLQKDEFNQLKIEQRDWLKQRNICGSDTLCLLQMYEQRISELSPNISTQNDSNEINKLAVAESELTQQTTVETTTESESVQPAIDTESELTQQLTSKIVITKYDFFTEGITKYSYRLSVKGSVQNIGAKDVKNVVIGFVCYDCVKEGDKDSDERIKAGWWVQIKEGYPSRQDKIAYLPAGGKESFDFEVGIAVSGGKPTFAPNVDIKIISFEEIN